MGQGGGKRKNNLWARVHSKTACERFMGAWVVLFFPSILGFLFNVFSNAVGAKTSVSDSYCMKKRRQPVVSCLLFIIELLGKESGETRTEQAGQLMEKKDKMDVILQQNRKNKKKN